MKELIILPWTTNGNFIDMDEEESDAYYNTRTEIVKYSYKGWFFDGKLEKKIGYDQGIIVNIEDYPEYIRQENITNIPDFKIKLDGIFAAHIIGIKYPCLGFFWLDNNGNQRGLVEMVRDNKGIKYACKQYLKKSANL
jgi:hypothetical protein